MNSSLSQDRRHRLTERFGFSPKAYFTLLSILNKQNLRLDFRTKKKESFLKAVFALAVFGGLVYLFKLFFSYCGSLYVFSLMGFTPLSVPSLLTETVLILSCFKTLADTTEFLYFSPDAKTMLVYPCSGPTVFLARVSSLWLKEYLAALIVEVPLLLGFMLNAGYPLSLLWLPFVLFAFYVLLMISLASCLSFPAYFLTRGLKNRKWLTLLLSILLLFAFIFLISYVLLLIPDRIDIFSNWGVIFNRIQDVLKYYKDHFNFLFQMTVLAVGYYDGYTVQPFERGSWSALFILLGVFVFSLALSLLLAFRFYFRLASQGEEGGHPARSFSRRSARLPFFWAQLSKERTVLLENPDLFFTVFTPFFLMPLLVALFNKILGAINTDAFGDDLAVIFNLAFILLIGLNSNSGIYQLYSEDRNAFSLSRSYPRPGLFLLYSKILVPSLFGTVSTFLSVFLFAYFKGLAISDFLLLGFGLSLIYYSHLLFSAGLAFNGEGTGEGAEKKEIADSLNITLTAFIASFVCGLFYFLFLQTDKVFPSLKILLLGVLFFAISLFLFIRKGKYVFMEGA